MSINKELFEDYAKAYSKYLLGDLTSEIYDVIRKIAELGGVPEAIQTYYIWQTKGIKNEKVNAHIESYRKIRDQEKDSNWEFALARSMQESMKEYFHTLSINGFPNKNNNGYAMTRNNDFALLSYITAANMDEHYQLSGNPFYLEKSIEIFDEIGIKTSPFAKFKAKHELGKLYKNNPEDPITALYYAKNLTIFGNNKQKDKGIEILKTLANQEYSKTLVAYDENHDQPINKTEERNK